MNTTATNLTTENARRLAAIEKKLDLLHAREANMDWATTTRSQRDRLRTQINELCAERNHLRGMGVRERMGDRRI